MAMKVLEVFPKDIHAVIELSVTRCKELREGISMSKIDYDGKNEVQTKAVKAVEEFWQLLDDVIKGVEQSGS